MEETRRGFLKSSAVLAATALTASDAFADEAPQGGERHVKVAVLSPTGGTMNAAAMVAAKISSDIEFVNQSSYASRQEIVEFSEDDLAIIGSPSYSGQIPRAEGLFGNLRGNNTPCIILAAFGNRGAEDTCAQIINIVERNGFIPIAAIKTPTPHIHSDKIGRSRPDVEDNRVMAEFAEKVLAKLDAGDMTPVQVEGEPTLHGEKNGSDVSKFYYPDNCTGCMTCVNECTQGAIDPDTMEIDLDKCLFCERCVYVCQFNGRSFDSSPNREARENHIVGRKPVSYYL